MVQALINVELFKAGVEAQLGGRKKLHQFVETESAEGLQVGTFQLVTNEYVGDATVVGAGAPIPVSDLIQTKTPVTFEKIAKGVKLNDEEMRQKFGDPVGNAENQTVAAIEGKMEAKVAALLKTATFSVQYAKTGGKIDGATVLAAVGTLGEGLEDAPYYLVVNPADYAGLQADIKPTDNTELQGKIYGAGVIMSARIPVGEAALIQQGAIKEIVQKDVDVEPKRDASTKSTEIFTDKIHAVYIADASKLVYIKKALV